MASAIAAAMPAPSPIHAEPVTAAVAAAANAEASILPSSPMSTTPDRSAKSPPSAARTSGRRSAQGRGGEERQEDQRVIHRAASGASGGASACASAWAGWAESSGRAVPTGRCRVPWAGVTNRRSDRLTQDEPVPHAGRDHAGLPAPEAEPPLAARLVQDDVEGAGEEIEELVALRVHLPLVGVIVGGLRAVLRPDHAVPVARQERPEDVRRPGDRERPAVAAEVHDRGEGIEAAAGVRAHGRLPAGAWRRNRASMGPRSAYSSAPQTRMIRPWITTTMSRVSLGMSNDSSDPPW